MSRADTEHAIAAASASGPARHSGLELRLEAASGPRPQSLPGTGGSAECSGSEAANKARDLLGHYHQSQLSLGRAGPGRAGLVRSESGQQGPAVAPFLAAGSQQRYFILQNHRAQDDKQTFLLNALT